MNWPLVSRARLEDAQKEIRRLHAELSHLIDVYTTAAAAPEPTKEPEQDFKPTRGRVTLAQIRSMANEAKRKEAEAHRTIN